MKHILDEFVDIAKIKPYATAISTEFSSITFDKLYELVQCYASLLARIVERSPQDKDQLVVAVVSDRSIDSIAAMLGIWMHGSVSLMLDPNLDKERVGSELSNARADFVLYDQTLRDIGSHLTSLALSDHQCHALGVDLPSDSFALRHPHMDNLYIAYSSGTTSFPKALLNTSKALRLAVQAHITKLDFSVPENRVLFQRSTTQFDGFYLEVMIALSSSAKMLVYGKSDQKALNYQGICFDQDVTDIIFPPSAAAAMIPQELPCLKNIVLAGEAPSVAEINRWLLATHIQVFNGYGLVQDGVCATLNKITMDDLSGDAVPVGKPIDGKVFLIINPATGEQVRPGESGHLCITGGGLAKGYVKEGIQNPWPSATSNEENHDWQKDGFITVPRMGGWLYKTGDKARQENGSYLVTGRLDRQIQIYGQTINPELIEDLLTTRLVDQGFDKTRVFVNAYEVSGVKRLQACIVAQLDENESYKPNLVNLLSKLHVVIPSRVYFKAVEKIDFFDTENDKKDLNKLKALLDGGEGVLLSEERTQSDGLSKYAQWLVDYTREIFNWPEDYPVSTSHTLFEIRYKSIDITCLLQTLQKKFQIELDFSLLPETLSIDTLATHLYNTIAYQHSLQPVNKYVDNVSPKAVLLMLHPVTGTVKEYEQTKLASSVLPHDIEIWTLASPWLIDDNELFVRCSQHRFAQTVEDQTRYVVQTVKARFGNIPYYIAGWSYGGTLALEVSEQLKKLNYDVVLTGVLDTASPKALQQKDDPLKTFAHLLKYLLSENTVDMPDSFEPQHHAFQSERGSLYAAVRELAQSCCESYQSLHPRKEDQQRFENIVNASVTNFLAGTQFERALPYDLDNVVMLASDQSIELGDDDDPYRAVKSQWQPFFSHSEFRCFEVKGVKHLQLLRADNCSNVMLQQLVEHASKRAKNYEDSEAVRRKRILAKVSQYLDQFKGVIEQVRGQSALYLLGATVAGKSTLLNYLNGTRYGYEPKIRDLKVVGGAGEVSTRVKGRDSGTLVPVAINLQSDHEPTPLVCVDFAGFHDTRDKAERITAAIGPHLVNSAAGPVKIAWVMSFSEVQGGRAALRKSFNNIVAIAPDPNGVDEFLQCLTIVATKYTGEFTTELDIVNGLKELQKDVAITKAKADAKREKNPQEFQRQVKAKIIIDSLIQKIELEELPIHVIKVRDDGHSRLQLLKTEHSRAPVDPKHLNFSCVDANAVEFWQVMRQGLNELQKIQRVIVSRNQQLVETKRRRDFLLSALREEFKDYDVEQFREKIRICQESIIRCEGIIQDRANDSTILALGNPVTVRVNPQVTVREVDHGAYRAAHHQPGEMAELKEREEYFKEKGIAYSLPPPEKGSRRGFKGYRYHSTITATEKEVVRTPVAGSNVCDFDLHKNKDFPVVANFSGWDPGPLEVALLPTENGKGYHGRVSFQRCDGLSVIVSYGVQSKYHPDTQEYISRQQTELDALRRELVKLQEAMGDLEQLTRTQVEIAESTAELENAQEALCEHQSLFEQIIELVSKMPASESTHSLENQIQELREFLKSYQNVDASEQSSTSEDDAQPSAESSPEVERSASPVSERPFFTQHYREAYASSGGCRVLEPESMKHDL